MSRRGKVGRAQKGKVAGAKKVDARDLMHPPKGATERRRDHRGPGRRKTSGPKINPKGAGGSGGYRRVRV